MCTRHARNRTQNTHPHTQRADTPRKVWHATAQPNRTTQIPRMRAPHKFTRNNTHALSLCAHCTRTRRVCVYYGFYCCDGQRACVWLTAAEFARGALNTAHLQRSANTYTNFFNTTSARFWFDTHTKNNANSIGETRGSLAQLCATSPGNESTQTEWKTAPSVVCVESFVV